MTQHSQKPQYIAAIDGLRAIAVLAVISNHLNSGWLPSGFLGVDIFFVISGYVITRSLRGEANSEKTLLSRLLDFYSRRIRRLTPALLLFVLVTSVVLSLFNPEPAHSGATAIASIFAVSNLYLFATATDYFGQAAELNFFTHTWTLALEEQFYLIYPLFLLAATMFVRSESQRAVTTLILSCSILASLALYLWIVESRPLYAFYLLPFRFWELGAGCMLALLLERRETGVAQKLPSQSNLTVLALVGVLFFSSQMIWLSTMLVVLLTCTLIAQLHVRPSFSTLLAYPILVKIGLMSYSLYLWHWGVIVTARWTFGDGAWSLFLQLSLITSLAWFSYRFVELPLRYKTSAYKSSVVFTMGLAASLAVAGLIYALTSREPSGVYLGSERTPAQIAESMESRILEAAADYSEIREEISERRRSCNMTPHHLSKDNEPPVVDEDFIAKCLSSEGRKLVLIGDSFANAISDHMAIAAVKNGYDFRMLFGYGCPYPLRKELIPNSNPQSCYADSHFLLLNLHSHLKAGDVLVHRLYYQKDQYIMLDEDDVERSYSAYAEEITRLQLLVRSKGASLLLVGTNHEIQQCSHREWFNRRLCPLEIDMSQHVRNKVAVGMNRFFKSMESAQSKSDFIVIDPIEILCSGEPKVCPVIQSDINLMRDRYHLSHAGVDFLYGDFEDALMRLNSDE
ncbi:acyltransferase family protein [Halioglobus pacificus]|uniref:acyltransferase family protein n=1 Tax=Parahalioglobus pacificus TaxID=930806 RepID=UPI00167AD511|nr:acyltransferase family protein [Halioglobus pacificus]